MELEQLLKKTAKKNAKVTAKIKKKRPAPPIAVAMDERPYQNDIPFSDPMRDKSNAPMGTRAILTGLFFRLAMDACDLAKEKTQEKLSNLRKRIRI